MSKERHLYKRPPVYTWAAPLLTSAALLFSSDSRNLENLYADNNSPAPVPEASVAPIGFDMEVLQCILPDGSVTYTSNFMMYDSKVYRDLNCKESYLKQIDQLKSWGIKTARVWIPVPELTYDTNSKTLKPFLNQNAQNVDEMLDAFHQAGIRVKVVLDTAYICQDREALSFDKNAFSDPEKRAEYLAAKAVVLEHLKDHPAIDAFDLFNEASREFYFISIPDYQCGTNPYTLEDIYNFLKKDYTLAREIAPQKKRVLSIDLLDFVTINFIMPYVGRLIEDGLIDELDIHVYNPSPQEAFETIAALKKQHPILASLPFYNGEIGWSLEQGRDNTNCEPNYYTKMTPECQILLRDATEQYIREARRAGSSGSYFHAWSSMQHRYGPVIVEDGKIVGWQPTPAGWCVIASNVSPEEVCTRGP